MFFVASKLVWFVIQPLVAVAIAAVAGLAAAALGWRAVSATLFSLAGLGYAVAMFSPAGLLLTAVLEDRFPVPAPPARVAGIVVLGGSFDTRVARSRGGVELGEAGDRITAAVALARRYPDAKIVFTGGVAAVFADDMSEAVLARQAFAALGIAPERLLIEDKARNTAENARYTRRLVDPKPGETWLLVTSAFHMPRSVGCFRAVGFPVLPYPVDFRTPKGADVWLPAVNDVSRNADKLQLAVREFIGLAGYRLSGRIETLFPAPDEGAANSSNTAARALEKN